MAIHPSARPVLHFTRRRRALGRALGHRAALVFSGGERARNYPANAYPYRADSHFLYLTGVSIPDSAVMIIDTRAVLFMHAATREDALWHGQPQSPAAIVRQTGVDAICPWSELPGALLQAGGPGRVATLPSNDPVTRARQACLLDRPWRAPGARARLGELDAVLADALITLRLIHDEAARTNLRAAAKGTTAAHLAGMAITRVGLREHDVRAAMEAELLRRGMETAYRSIVSVRGEVLHNNAYDNELTEGQLIVADVGGEYNGWAGDVTRTWPVSGTFSPTQRDVYQVVLEAQQVGVDMVRTGTRYRDIHIRVSVQLARGLVDLGLLRGDPDSLVERGAHALFFPHGVGHLLGLDVHDMEDLGDRAGYAPGRERGAQFGIRSLRLDRDLRPGMAVTIEPGIYFVPAILEDPTLREPFERDGALVPEGWTRFSDVRGIRIEDDVLCTHDAPEVLSAAIPKHVHDVEARVDSRR